jgi:alanine racemase
MFISFSQLSGILHARVIKTVANEQVIEFLLTDSRKIAYPSRSVFFAIKGERHDGHKFLEDVYKSGVRMFVIESEMEHVLKEILAKKNFEADIIVVENCIHALQVLTAYRRKQFHIPVIGITGSNAKTIIKEWLSQLISPEYTVVRNPKSYNSQLGVPLSVWQMSELHTIGVFEAGISKPGEMEQLQKIIQPTIGLFANIGSAHDEGFESKEQKIIEKLKLFSASDLVFYSKNHKEIDDVISKTNLKTVSWSYKEQSDYKVEVINITRNSVTLIISKPGNIQWKAHTYLLPFNDFAAIENLLHCITILLHFDFEQEIIQKKLASLKPISMRLELKEGINGCYVIDDSYNNDLAGLTIALDFLKQQNQKTNKTLILSDLFETGLSMSSLYQLLADTIKEKGVTKLIGIGSEMLAHKDLFRIPATFFESTEKFISSEEFRKFLNEIILVKGARAFEFERIVKLLQQKSHRTVLEINLDALSHNLNYYRAKLNPDTKIMVMVKSFAYGAGSLEVANLLQFHRADYLAVAYADEAVTLRNAGITLPMMIMNPSEEDFNLMVTYKLEPVVYSLSFFNLLSDYMEKNDVRLSVHLEIETGMNRLGINEKDVPEIVNRIKRTEKVVIASVFSHLAGADEDQFHEYTHIQFGILLKAAAFIENQIKYKVVKHILNSAGIVRYPDFQLDMVRLGIGLYGVESNGKEQGNLVPVGTLKTTISQIKNVKKGETVGYSRKGKAEEDMTIGIIAIGYGDGYSRRFSNGVGRVCIDGKFAPVIGNVCMDMTMIDLSGIDANEGDEVVIFGKERSIIELAKSIQAIPYELLTGVSERVKRVFYSE